MQNYNFFDMCEIETSLFDKYFAENDKDWNLIKEIYENFNFKSTNLQIPKIIHFIWLGSSLPKPYRENIEDWKQKNKTFDIKIWSDEESEKFLKNKNSYSTFINSKSFGVKSDVLRYEILNSEGGLYVDTDFLCLSDKFNELHESLSFYAGICLERPVQINNGIMASCPDHPILKSCILNASETTHMNISCKETRVLYQTGPWLLTNAILDYIKYQNIDNIAIFPSQYFHPFPAAYRHQATEELIKSYIKPWSMACHLWHASWQPKSIFYTGDKND